MLKTDFGSASRRWNEEGRLWEAFFAVEGSDGGGGEILGNGSFKSVLRAVSA
ncbi:hypothetical protein CLOSTASPAR_05902 [[Clostridium] asparagiforme DSM 15981]|uniref:Uncharacterized protein n=1 Tax=[Clostridium] asparagiforme DSM 15981 TaxID=518636 RepID=C0D9F2_9FIRM|nr:hypothetical protein CLOSTASPAR_05902 [[Clostridium] asparagiforme DSM 15981]